MHCVHTLSCGIISIVSLMQVDEGDDEGEGGEEDSSEEYLVDHSSYIYLVGPGGQCLDFFGKGQEAGHVAESVRQHMQAWRAGAQS
jgi:hypothetical protein